MNSVMCRSLIVGAVLAMAAPFAGAGLVVPNGNVEVVHLPDGRGSARGVMGHARVARNEVEFIGCGVRHAYDGAGGLPYKYAFCQAADGADLRGVCQTTHPDMVEAIRAIADFSYVVFDWNANGECTYLGNSTQSFYLPGVAY